MLKVYQNFNLKNVLNLINLKFSQFIVIDIFVDKINLH